MWCKFVLICVLYLVLINAEDEETGTEKEELKQNKELVTYAADNQEKWHAMDYRLPGSQDWVPADNTKPSTDSEEPLTKRRRPGRKRKRRPQNREGQIYNESFDDGFERPILRPRAKRPQRLDQHIDEDHWEDEMMAEEPFRPLRNYNRRRLYPKYDVEEEAERVKYENEGTTYKYAESDNTEEPERRGGYKRRPYAKRKYKNNFDDSITEKMELTTNSPTAPSGSGQVDLKALLKQSGGISLSELLQQRNLSLADLLKGEQHAISALTSIPEVVSEPSDQFVMQSDEQYNRRPNANRRLPSIKRIHKPQQEENNFNRNNNDNLLSSKSDVTEYTTERRIFVPSHPKYYTSVDYKPNMKDLSSIKSTESFLNTVDDSPTMSTTTENSVTQHTYSVVSSSVTFSTSENPTVLKTKLKSRARHTLPPTLAKLKNLAAKTTMKTVTENYPKLPIISSQSEIPVKAIKINLNDLFGMPKLANNLPKPSQTIATSTSSEGPLKISVNIEQFIEENNEDLIVKTTEIDVTESADKLKDLTAKDEIMEILSDTATRKNLTRLLELRNMTLDELVEQRERGSSQRHLADIFHNKTKEPEPTEEMVVDQIVKGNEKSYLSPPSLFETFPAFELRPDNNIQSTHYTRESREDQFTISKEDKPNLNGNSNEILGQLIPVWRQAYTNNKNNNKFLQDKIIEDDLIIKDEAKRIEDIDNQLVDTISEAFNIDVINHHKTYVDNLSNLEEENEFFRLPYGVRSAIIASAIIIAISLVVFLTIFIIFKWTQKQHTHLNYTNSFSSAKIKTPILETPYQRRIFSSIMNATLGRKKKIPTISCTEPQSLQEYLWENERKPFQ